MLDETDDQSDADLIAACGCGDRSACGALVARFERPVLHLVRALVRDPALAEDVFQETFLAVVRSASSYRGEGAVSAWIYGIARHTAARTRRAGREVASDDRALDRLALDAGWGSSDVESAVAAGELRQRLVAALDELPDADRELLIMRDGVGMSGTETASVLGIGLDAMKSRLHRARLQLAARLRGRKGGSDVTR